MKTKIFIFCKLQNYYTHNQLAILIKHGYSVFIKLIK